MPAATTAFAAVTTLRRWTRAAIFCACSLFCAGFSMGQGLTPVSVSDYLHAVHYTGMSGDTMKFRFSLGDIEQPVTDAAGFQLDFSFPKLSAAPTVVLVGVGNTWLTAGLSAPTATWSFDASAHSLSVDYVRSDEEGQTGHGSILSIALVRPEGFSTTEASMYLDGGVVMVENISLRTAQGAAPPAPKGQKPSAANPATSLPLRQAQGSATLDMSVYPNPATDYVDVRVAQPKGATLSLWSLNATLISEQACRASQRIDLQYLPSGSYLLKLEGEGEMVQRLIVKQ